jgi:hypothetical protein
MDDAIFCSYSSTRGTRLYAGPTPPSLFDTFVTIHAYMGTDDGPYVPR